MKKLKEMKRLFSVMFAATAVAISVSAEDVEIAIQGDLVSSYVWRGMYQTGTSIQPTLGVGYKGLSLTAWGSTDFDGASSSDGTASKEVDLTLAYAFEKGLTISVVGGRGNSLPSGQKITDFLAACVGDKRFCRWTSAKSVSIPLHDCSRRLPSMGSLEGTIEPHQQAAA